MRQEAVLVDGFLEWRDTRRQFHCEDAEEMTKYQSIKFAWRVSEEVFLIFELHHERLAELIDFLNNFIKGQVLPVIEIKLLKNLIALSPGLNVIQWKSINGAVTFLRDLLQDDIVAPSDVKFGVCKDLIHQ